MRQQILNGYVLHQRPYQENRSLIYFLSKEVGVIHGIGKKNLPMFLPITLFANGKNSLKTFSQSQALTHSSLTGQGMYAGLYLNELMFKLLPVEEAVLPVFDAYEHCLNQISQTYQTTLPSVKQLTDLKWYLRQFETLMLEELGYGIDFLHDTNHQIISANTQYHYRLQQGFMPVYQDTTTHLEDSILGSHLLTWQRWLNNPAQFEIDYVADTQKISLLLNQMGKLYRKLIDHLLNYENLKSRELWQQLTRLQTD